MENLKIILTDEKLSYILYTLDLDPVGQDVIEEEIATYKMCQNDSSTVKCNMLASMINELRRQYESLDILFILLNLKELYGEQSRTTRSEISKQLFCTKMSERTSIQDQVLMIIDLITRLSQLDFMMDVS